MRTITATLFTILLLQVALYAADIAPSGNATAGKADWLDRRCRNCHGDLGQGAFGPDLAGRGLTFAQFKQAVRKPWGIMPAFNERQASDQVLSDMQAYLLSLPKVDEPGPWTEKLPPQDSPHGQILFVANGCSQCHGPEGQRIREVLGGEAADVDFAYFSKIVYSHTERYPDGRMGNFSRIRLPEGSLEEISHFLFQELGFLVPLSATIKPGAPAGGNTTFTLNLENQGEQGKGLTAEGLTIALALAPGTTVVRGTGTGYQGVKMDPDLKTNAAIWQVASIAPKEQQSYTITVSGNAGKPADLFKGSVVRWTKPEMRKGAATLTLREPKLPGKDPQTIVQFPAPKQAER